MSLRMLGLTFYGVDPAITDLLGAAFCIIVAASGLAISIALLTHVQVLADSD